MRHLRGQAGFSLVEMMIAVVIGMILIAGAYRLFVGSTRSYKQQDDLSRLQENVRLATQVMARDIWRAGGPRFSLGGIAFAGTAVTATNCATANCSDTIAVSYVNDANNLTTVTYSVAGGILSRNDTAPIPPMVSGPVVDGVENMQVLYGMDINADASVDTYANDLSGGGTCIAVRVGLLMRTVNEVPEAGVDTATYDVNGDGVAEYGPIGDRRLRRLFTSTYTLRNQLQ